MFVPASPEHVPAIPDQLPVEPLLAPNPPELDNDYLDTIDYDDEEEPYEDLDDEEEDPEENPEMDLDKEEEDPEIDIDDEEEEEPLSASPPPLSLLRTPPPMSKSSSDSDIPVTTTINVGRPFKGPLSTYEVGGPSSVASASVFSARYELNQLEHDFGVLGSRVQSLTRGMGTRRIEIAEAHKEAIRARKRLDRFIWEMSFVIERDIPELMNDSTATGDRLTLLEQDNVKNREEIQKLKNQVHSANISATLAAMDRDRIEKTQDQNAASAKAAEVARAAAAAETTRAATTVGGAGGSNNTGPDAGTGGPNVAGPTVGAIAMNAVPEVRGCSYTEFMKCEPTKFKGAEGAVGLTRWFERSESVFLISKCAENDKVKYATSTLLDEALSWWNSVAQPIDIENAYKIPLVELKKMILNSTVLAVTYKNWKSNSGIIWLRESI
ncbi:hypothetical protein Tco_1185753 [Tanacetum coccineum]